LPFETRLHSEERGSLNEEMRRGGEEERGGEGLLQPADSWPDAQGHQMLAQISIDIRDYHRLSYIITETRPFGKAQKCIKK
jgi:hypothetical protein